MPIVIPHMAPSGTVAFHWVDPGGVVRAISGSSNVAVKVGAQGLGAPGIALAEDKLPFAAGSLVRHASVQPREIDLPLIFGPVSSPAAMESLLDAAFSWFATADEQRRTPGYLRVTRADGTQRQVACYYVSGLEGDLSASRAGDVWQEAVIRLRSADPWATAIEPVEQTWITNPNENIEVINAGQLDAYPVWTITGPTSRLFAFNGTLNVGWQLILDDNPLPAGKTITVDLRPATQRTTTSWIDSDGNNRFSELQVTSVPWLLPPGQSNIALINSDTSSATSYTLSYVPRYYGLYR